MTAREHRPSSDPSRSDAGLSVRIRPIRASDAPLVLDAFTRLSDRSRRLRFLMGKRRLTDAELRYFTVVDDWQGHGLGTRLIARLIERAREEGVGRFTGLVDNDNVVVAGMLQKFGAGARVVDDGHGAGEFEIALNGWGTGALRDWPAAG